MLLQATLLFVGLSWTAGVQGQCLPHDSEPPKCFEWVSPDHGEPVFIEHIYNCSRFWVCQPDLSDCLHECAPAGDGGALYFDVRDQYPSGPTCNWPNVIDCEMRPDNCSICHPWQECLPGPICTPDCKLDTHCSDEEYCDYKEGGEGHCHVGCRTGSVCEPCGDCVDHQCPDLECCTNDDCHGLQCVDGRCKCVADDDCATNQYCDDGDCREGCRDDASCIDNGVCATCDENHVCSEPECCTDTDCQVDCEFATCQTDNTCTVPECCTDDDCPAGAVCEGGLCSSCSHDSECPLASGQCDSTYTTCEYCNILDGNSVGQCAPGCAGDDNCDGKCNGDHKCFQAGDNVLLAISFTTATCNGCETTPVENGAILHLRGKKGREGYPECSTAQLDHADSVDYTAGQMVEFTDELSLKHCHYYNLHGAIVDGNVTWSQPGEWSVQNQKITFTWSDGSVFPFSCCLSEETLSATTNTANLINCGEDEGDFTC